MELNTIWELLIAILPSGAATIVVGILAVLLKSDFKKVIESVNSTVNVKALKKDIDELKDYTHEVQMENIELKEEVAKLLRELHHVEEPLDGKDSIK